MDEIGHDVNVTESVLTDRFPLPIYQDPHELKKRRNRLAQRKHRQRLTSTESSATGKRQCVSEPVAVQLPTPENDEVPIRYVWDSTGASDHFSGFEHGAADSSLGFHLSTSSRNGGRSRQTSPELEQFISRIWQPNFDGLGTGCLPDVTSNSPGCYLHCSNMTYEPSGVPTQHELQLPRIRGDSGSTLPMPGMVSMPQKPLPTLFHGTISNTSADILDSPRTDPEMRNEAGHSSNSPKRDSPRRSFSNYQQSSPSTSSQNVESLETRFERVMKAVDEAGFKSIDDMSTQYYTAAFREDTTPFWAQSRSRSRSLPRLLASLHESTKTWAARDVETYKQQVTNLAEDIYVNELSNAKQNLSVELHHQQNHQHQETASTSEQNDRIIENLWAAISDIELSQELKEKKAILRENMPELWSSLLELARKADLCQPRGSQAVGAFFLLLASCIS